MLQVLDLGATIYGDGRRETLIEKLALIVTQDYDGFGSGFLEFLSQRLHGPVTLFKPRVLGLHRNFGGESGRPFSQQSFIIVGLSAKPVLLVFAIGLGSKIPFLGRGGEQRSVRRSDTENDFCHRVPVYLVSRVYLKASFPLLSCSALISGPNSCSKKCSFTRRSTTLLSMTLWKS